MRIGNRQIDTPAAKVGTRVPFRMSATAPLHSLLIVVTATWTVVGGSGAGVIFTDAIYRLIRSITISMGGGPVQTWTGQTLRAFWRIFGNEAFTQIPPTDLTSAAEPIKLMLEVPFFMPGVLAENAFALPAMAPGANPNGVIEFGTAAELMHDADGALSLADFTATIFERPLLGPDVPQNIAAYGVLVARQTEVDITASGEKRIPIEGTIPGQEIRAVLVEQLEDVASDGYVPSNSIITDLEFQIDGRPEFERTPFSVIQNLNKVQYGLSAIETGVGVLDAAEDKNARRGALYPVNTAQRPELVITAVKSAVGCRIRVTAIIADRRHQPTGGAGAPAVAARRARGRR